MTYQGKLYAVPQVIDMQLLVYRKTLLDKAGVTAAADHRRAHRRREEADHRQRQGPLPRQRRRRRASWAARCCGRPASTTSPRTTSSASTTRAAAEALGKLRDLFTSGSLLLGAPTDWSDPSAFTPGAHRDAVDRPVDPPRPQEGLGDDFGVLPWPDARRLRRSRRCRSAPTARASAPRARTSTPPRSSSSGCGSTRPTTSSTSRSRYGFHIPARKSLAAKADKLKSGPAADAAKLRQRERPRADAAAVDAQVRQQRSPTR